MNNSSSNNKWILRRIQIAAIIIITALFLARIYIPPISPDARAEKLYLDGWYLGIHHDIWGGYSGADNDRSIKMFMKALELSPGNSLYEQALAWKCPEKDLKNLIENGKLGKKALILASYRYEKFLDRNADNDAQMENIRKQTGPRPIASAYMLNSKKHYSPEYWKAKLNRLDKLAKVDPENALIRYRRAYIYGSMGRQSDMLNEVRKANSMDLCVIRMPEVSPLISNTIADPRTENIFQDYAQFRELAREIVGYSNEQLRARNVSSALATSQEACRMGVKLTSMEPSSYINYLVAAAVFSIGRVKFDSICRNFGMTDEMKKYQSVNTVFDKGISRVKRNIPDVLFIPKPFSTIASYANFALVSIISFILFLVLWGMASLIRKIMRRQKVDIKAWDEGWLLKMMLAIYLPLILIIIISSMIWYMRLFPGIFGDYEIISGIISSYIDWITIAVQVVLATILMFKLKKQYSVSVDEKVSLLRFKLRIPIEVRAWICRSYTLMFGAQVIFLLCFGMLASQFFISRYRAYPWQIERIPFYNQDVEKATALKLSDEMKNFAIENSIIKGNNSKTRVSGR